MCGIVGQFFFQNQTEDTLRVISNLIDMMIRRGPDDEGIWTDSSHCTLGFRRLSILDLSPSGHQPMLSAEGRFSLVMNGEVYNFRELRQELEGKGYQFRSSGDAEVVLYSLVEWGRSALQRFNGMFALAFYDTFEKRLLLARDYAGIKPLYYLHTRQGLVFGSQYDQILAHPWAHNLPYNQEAAALYLRFGAIPAPYAILEQTYALQAGSWLEIDIKGRLQQGQFFEFPIYQPPDLSGQAAYDAVDEAITRAVKRQMISDVPLGSFLSGGIDSPLVTATAQLLSSYPIKAFTIGVEDDQMDESENASRYADEIGVEHHLQKISLEHVEDLVQDVVLACSEPFGDYSIFPTLLVSRFASEHVKVMLSGDGGDELFWGYTGRMGRAIRNAGSFRIPQIIRKGHYWLRRDPKEWSLQHFHTAGQWYQSSHEHNFESILKQYFPGISPFPFDFDRYDYHGGDSDQTAQWVRWNEFTGHMQIPLLKVDRGSMYHSLEVRVPLLDKEVINTALRVDWRSCLDLGTEEGKIPLRRALAKKVHYQTTEKKGFSVPMQEWLRGPLRPIFEEKVLGANEIFGLTINHHALRQVFNDHLSGKRNSDWGLWILLSAALWQEKARTLR